MGTGKTEVGKRLAKRLGLRFLDTDAQIQRATGKTIPQIFNQEGEESFRNMERLVTQSLSQQKGLVIATGGGLVLNLENVRDLQKNGILICLTAGPEIIYQRVKSKKNRPLLKTKKRDLQSQIEELMTRRSLAYQVAEYTIDTSNLLPDKVADEIIAYLKATENLTTSVEEESMPADVFLDLSERSYHIYIAGGLLGRLGSYIADLPLHKKTLVVTNPKVRLLYGGLVEKNLRQAGFQVIMTEVPDGEEAKNLSVAQKLYDLAYASGLDRRSPVIALGGGVVGDLAGFVAATYMRGVPFIQLPTTLLAQVDSSIGGKVAVNHPRGKNIIGAFYQPKVVLADIKTLFTLDLRELRAGLAEVIKYGVIADACFFTWLEDKLEKILSLDPKALLYTVATSCQIKARIVEKDETEQGRRAILNFGHTIGHAIEALTGYRLFLHGEAVAMGMVLESELARIMGIVSEKETTRLKTLLKRAGLPVALPPALTAELVKGRMEEFLYLMQRDKKALENKYVFALPKEMGATEIFTNVPEEMVKKILLSAV